mgnify:CR=1 FL=1
MTRKDYVNIANAIVKIRRFLPRSEGALVTSEMHDMLSREYDNFDSLKWHSYIRQAEATQ